MTHVRERGPLRFALLLAAIPCAVSCSQEAETPLTSTARLPGPGAEDVCPDSRLRITFSSPVTAAGGEIRIFDAADDTAVETIDVADVIGNRSIGGLPNFNYYRVLISGDEVEVQLSKPLEYGSSYYVHVDAGAFEDRRGSANVGVTDEAWRFSTRTAPPAAGARELTVAADGSGDFATVQGALDFIPDGNTDPVTVLVREGTYREIVCLIDKHAITILGEDRKKSIICYANSQDFNDTAGGQVFGPDAGPPYSADPARGDPIYRRGVFLAHHANDLVVANLTLRNDTPPDGPQAEALILNGSPSARAILTELDLYGYQDTLQINGPAYVSSCYLEGDFDFMWGTGPCFFVDCEARILRSDSNYARVRNPDGHHGYVYSNCRFDGAPDVTGSTLALIDPERFPTSEMVLLDCVLTDAVGASGWRLRKSDDARDVRFWEYDSRRPDGAPVDTSGRAAFSRRLELPGDEETIERYRDPRFVLGGEWDPTTAEIFTTRPPTAREPGRGR